MDSRDFLIEKRKPGEPSFCVGVTQTITLVARDLITSKLSAHRVMWITAFWQRVVDL